MTTFKQKLLYWRIKRVEQRIQNYKSLIEKCKKWIAYDKNTLLILNAQLTKK